MDQLTPEQRLEQKRAAMAKARAKMAELRASGTWTPKPRRKKRKRRMRKGVEAVIPPEMAISGCTAHEVPAEAGAGQFVVSKVDRRTRTVTLRQIPGGESEAVPLPSIQHNAVQASAMFPAALERLTTIPRQVVFTSFRDFVRKFIREREGAMRKCALRRVLEAEFDDVPNPLLHVPLSVRQRCEQVLCALDVIETMAQEFSNGVPKERQAASRVG